MVRHKSRCLQYLPPVPTHSLGSTVRCRQALTTGQWSLQRKVVLKPKQDALLPIAFSASPGHFSHEGVILTLACVLLSLPSFYQNLRRTGLI